MAARIARREERRLQMVDALLQETPCDHHALHLVGALVDLGGLPPQPYSPVLTSDFFPTCHTRVTQPVPGRSAASRDLPG
jgi:hypothetical protein